MKLLNVNTDEGFIRLFGITIAWANSCRTSYGDQDLWGCFYICYDDWCLEFGEIDNGVGIFFTLCEDGLEEPVVLWRPWSDAIPYMECQDCP